MTLESTIAGSWYPGSASGIRALAEKWERMTRDADAAPRQSPNVLFLPHAGWAYSGETAWSAVRMVGNSAFRRVVVLAPSHRAWIENRLVAPESDSVSTPLGDIEIDGDWLARLSILAPVTRSDDVHRGEHAAQIEYPLLQLALAHPFKIVPLVMGGFGADQMGMCARALSRLVDAETLLVVSSDFTHYGDDFSYSPFGTDGGDEVREKVAARDAEALSLISRCDADGFSAFIKRTGATICGRVPIEMALRAFPSGTTVSTVRYATSGDDDRDFRRFVCYAAAAAHAEWPRETDEFLDAETRTFLLRVARKSMEAAVHGGNWRSQCRELVSNAPEATRARMGAFVTLNDKVTGALRGCIGEILPMRPLVEAVAVRAVDAALRDPRFTPVSGSELTSLRVEISALSPPKPVASWREIVRGRDGMTLERDGRFAVFLPQVAPEQGWDLPTTLSHLSRKAGLASDAWRDGATFETFQAEVFHE